MQREKDNTQFYSQKKCKIKIIAMVLMTLMMFFSNSIVANARYMDTITNKVYDSLNPYNPYPGTIEVSGAEARTLASTHRQQESVGQNSISNTTENFKESDMEWLSDFSEIEEEKLKEKLKTKEVTSAAANSTAGSLYIVLDNKDHYKIQDVSQDLLIYLKVCGVELQSLAFTEEADSSKKSNINWSAIWTCVILFSIFFIPFYITQRNKKKITVGGLNSSNKKADEGIPDVKFSDVEGVEELKQDVMRLVDCLKNPEKYKNIGARPPKGVIFYGPPGTGKTLLAKAIAGEAGVPFFSEVGSNFVEMYVGVGASRVRELYKKARKAAPCIVFIDEIDAVAGQRGSENNSERDQTINALLAELDGFNATKNIITICATNRLDMLDSAFKRAGRFDLKLAVGLPDKKGRRKILEIHSKDKKLNEEIDLDVLANKTSGFSGAELEALLNESALTAVGKNKEEIDYEDIDDAFFKIVMQGNKKKREKVTEMNRIVAWHEAGHTLATKLLTNDSVSSVTIVGSSSGAGGVTFRNPKEDNMLQSKKYLENSIKVMYAGRAAEEIYFKDPDSITTGASQDIKQATSIIRDYLSLYGMGDKGMIDLSQFERDFKSIVDEASILSKELYQSVLDLFKENYNILKALAEKLLEEETLDEAQIDETIKLAKIKS